MAFLEAVVEEVKFTGSELKFIWRTYTQLATTHVIGGIKKGEFTAENRKFYDSLILAQYLAAITEGVVGLCLLKSAAKSRTLTSMAAKTAGAAFLFLTAHKQAIDADEACSYLD